MENIMVVFGGKSVEHDISIITGVQIANVCAGLGFNVLSVYIDKNHNWFLHKGFPEIKDFKKIDKKIFTQVMWISGQNKLYTKESFSRLKELYKIDFTLICTHGKNGEDGYLAGLMENSFVPYSSSNLISSGVSLDKQFMKNIFTANNISTVPYICVHKQDYIKNKNNTINNINDTFLNSTIIKPACLGSSIGISKATGKEELKQALDLAFTFDSKVVVEQCLSDFIEVNCSVMKDKENNIIASNCEYPNKNSSLFSFNDKYINSNLKMEQSQKLNKYSKLDSTEQVHLLSEETEKQVKDLAKQIYTTFDAGGIVRIDFMFDNQTQALYANEINSIPGSLSINLWLQSGQSYSSTIKSLIRSGKENFLQNQKLTTHFSSSVLDHYNI